MRDALQIKSDGGAHIMRLFRQQEYSKNVQLNALKFIHKEVV